MSLTVTQLRAYVRDFLDTDSTELPDTLLDVWQAEAIDHIAQFYEPWSFFENEYSFNTNASANNQFTFATISSLDRLQVILEVRGPNWQLQYIPYEEARRRYTYGGTFTGEPYEWSVRPGGDRILYLWPDPAGASYAMVARGYDKPLAPATVADSPDLPSEFHPLVGEWMLARAYEKQDDLEASASKFARVEQQLDRLRLRYTRPPGAGVQSIGAGGEGSFLSRNGFPYRLRYSWET